MNKACLHALFIDIAQERELNNRRKHEKKGTERTHI